MKCNKDCLNCTLEDCINDRVYPEKSRYKNRPEEQKEYQKRYTRIRYWEAKEKGLCTVCKKRKAKYGTKCYECYIRQKKYDKAKYDGIREKWKESGLCYFCGSEVLPGKQVCKKHYQKLCRNIKKCNEHENTKKARKGWIKRNELIFSKNG